MLDGAGNGAVGALAEIGRQLLADVAQAEIGAPRGKPREIGAHRAGRRGDRHVVVVEDDDQPGVERAGIVHGLIGHAGRHGAVADDGDDIVPAALQIARHGHAEAGGDRGRGMRRAERIVFALAALGEAGQAAFLAKRADAVAAAGQDLVRIGLVADVPDQPIFRRVEDVVQGDGQFDDAQPGAEMAAGDRHCIDKLGAQFAAPAAAIPPRAAHAGRPECGPCPAGVSGAVNSRGQQPVYGSDGPEIGPRRPNVNVRYHRRPNAMLPATG